MQITVDRSGNNQFELGLMFIQGPDDRRNYKKAAKLFKRSAMLGNADAQYKIGLMYSRGIGVSLDYIKSYVWLKIAAAQGSRKSIQYLKKIVTKIPHHRLREAHKLSRQYYRIYVK